MTMEENVSSMTVMIVDDDRTVADLAAAVLGKDGFVCTIADQGADLLAQVKSVRPDCVVVDIMMPQIDGLELCRLIKTDKDLGRTKVIVLSGKAYDFDKRRARQAGADGYITKPLVPDAFAKAIRDAVGGTFSVACKAPWLWASCE